MPRGILSRTNTNNKHKIPFRVRNHRSSLARFLRWKLKHAFCFACSATRAPITCKVCKRSHCLSCCLKGFDLCMNCMIQLPGYLYRIQDVHSTFRLDRYAQRSCNTRLLLEKVPFLTPCHLCFTTGLHKLCEKCVSDTCDACLFQDCCRCLECLKLCSYCRQEGITVVCLNCEKLYCLDCMDNYDVCMFCSLP